MSFKKDKEVLRLKELYNLQILDTEKELRFDQYTKLVADIFNIPIVIVSLIDVNRQWFKACLGLEVSEMPRSVSFCTYTIEEREILVIPNALKDKRFNTNPLVLNEPFIRFYAGAVLRGPTGKALGTLCLIDKKPRSFSTQEENLLIQFARLVEHELSYTYHLNEMRKKIEQTIYFDSVTELPNRRLLLENLNSAIRNSQANSRIAVIAIRLNRFKELENVLGSVTSETILKETAKRLKEIYLNHIAIARWDDDVFTLVLPVSPDYSYFTSILIQKIESLFAELLNSHDRASLLTPQIGVSIYPQDSENGDELVQHALYAMRAPCVNNISYRFYSDEVTKQVIQNYELEILLNKALEENALTIVYQPRIDVKSEKICGAEALCRWKDSKGNDISPMTFVSIAEQSDLIIKLGRFVLKRVCEDIAQWNKKGYKKIPMSINISPKHLLSAGFIEEVTALLTDYQIEPNYIDLEITESSFLIAEEALLVMNALCKLGITFSLDDFGTGFSSLSYLQKLPLKTLKIDKAFITNLHLNKNDNRIARTIIVMAKTLNLISLAEGVEREEQFKLLKKYQCSQIQGYLFSPPLEPNSFIEKTVKLGVI
ncbi:sensor domain-containing phosphodiesterase [Legionella sp. CNM-1927-20]|uniref:sensor domain-containing phosphodiesterase n=1 Tax=Legionella sp. CNM-1927-20 TaxID=3422221 RepID=UPI00403B0EC1